MSHGVSTDRLWAWTALERHAIADLLESITFEQSNDQSWCDGWRVRDVAGHVLWTEQNAPAQLVRSAFRSGPTFNGMIAAEGLRAGLLPTPELVARLHADAARRSRGSTATGYLTDVIVHTQDMARPLGVELAGEFGTGAELPDEAIVVALRKSVSVYRYMFGLRPAAKGVRLVATDMEFRHGDGPDVTGRGIDLLLFVTGRGSHVVSGLSGEGLVAS